MSLSTCDVRVRVYKQDGEPDAGIRVVALLNRFDVEEGYVGPTEVEETTDINGVATLTLWRNALGSTESLYKVRIEGSERTLVVSATVPDAATADLENIAALPAYPGKADGDLAAEAAGEQAAIATTQAGIATTQAGAAASSAATATAQAVIATAQAGISTAQAVISTAQAGAAATSAATALASLVTVSATAPLSPMENTEWIDSDTGRHYTWLEDTDGFQWVETFAAQVVDNPTLVTPLIAWVDQQNPSVFMFMTDEQIADVQEGTRLYDVVPAATLALATGRPVRFEHGPGWSYKFESALSVPSNSTLFSEGAELYLADGADDHIIRVANSADNVEIRGFRINGNKANNSGGNGIAMGGTGGTNIRIHGNYIFDVAANGIYLSGTTVSGISVRENYVTTCGIAGISANDTVTKFAFNDNFCWLNNTHGVGIIGTGTHGTINNNVCWDNGQGSPTADNITGYAVANDDITVTGNTCYGGLNNGIHMGGTRITITGNVVYNATQYGIAMRPDTGAGDDCVVSSNIVYSSGISGIWIESCNSGVVANNVSHDNAAHGFAIDNCTNVAFTGNTARGNAIDGFKNGTASAWLTFTGNTSRSNGGDGIELNNVTQSVVSANMFNLNTGWGINVSGTEGNNSITNNIAKSNTAGQIAQPAVTTRVSGNETNTSRNVASATTVTLPPNGEYFYVTGTTTITSITASWAERRVTLQFDDALTFTDGSNLNIAGNFVTTFKDSITLISDGTNWVECSRSVN